MTGKLSKRALISTISGLAAFLGLLLTAAFLDLKINIALYNPDSLFGQFFEYLGEAAAYIAPAAAFLILYQAVPEPCRFRKALRLLFGFLSVVGVGVFVNYFMGKFFFAELMYKYVYLAVFTAILTPALGWATGKIDKQIMRRLAVFAVLLLVVLAVSQIVVQAAKGVWSRLRFRNMNTLREGFTPWYKPNFGIKGRESLIVSHPYHADSDAFHSFPSGHTAAAAISVCLILLPDLFDKLKKNQGWFYVLPFVYTCLVALSRIIVGAHFLSDVLVGGGVTVGTVFLARWIILLIINKRRGKLRQGEL